MDEMSDSALLSPAVTLDGDVWRARELAHQQRADLLTADHRARSGRNEKHPVWDFLFTYYSYKPAVLRRWHPGVGVALAGGAGSDHSAWRWYTLRESADVDSLSVGLDLAAFLADRGDGVRQIAALLRATQGRPARFGCFGMHEWAMVYRDDEHRHTTVPLRLGRAGTDEVVEAHDLRCTHFDAFRFFTPPAVPRNELPLSRATQMEREQPGCLHAGMDLYKWAIKLGPLIPGGVLLDAFELARDIRQLDMEASPYDLVHWGFSPVAVETPDGKAEYVRRQREFAVRGEALRATLLEHCTLASI